MIPKSYPKPGFKTKLMKRYLMMSIYIDLTVIIQNLGQKEIVFTV